MSAMNVSGFIDRYFIKQPRIREAMTRVIYGRSDAVVLLFDRSFSINRLKENGYLRAANRALHTSLFRDEAVILQRLPLFCEDDMTFVDVGANIGIFSACMASVSQVRRNFNVMAFEVHPDTFSRLRENARRHGFQAFNTAIAAEAQTMTFVEGAVSHVTTATAHSNSYNIASRTFEVEARRLDSFEFGGSILLKIDVEGQELAVLEGASKLFDQGRVRAVYIDGYGDIGVLDFLRDRGFELRDCRTLEKVEGDVFSLLALKVSRTN